MRRYEDYQVYRRYADGMCVMDRVCRRCGREYIGPRNICSKCRNEQWRSKGKFNKQYHRNYYHKKLSKKTRHVKSRGRRRFKDPHGKRRAAYDRHMQRIWREMQAIREAGLDPDQDSMQTILSAGIKLEEFDAPDQRPGRLFQ